MQSNSTDFKTQLSNVQDRISKDKQSFAVTVRDAKASTNECIVAPPCEHTVKY